MSIYQGGINEAGKTGAIDTQRIRLSTPTEWEKQQKLAKDRARPIGSKATLNGKPVLWAGVDYAWQSPESFKMLKNKGYFAAGEAQARAVNRILQPVGEVVGQGLHAGYKAFIEPYQGALQKQIGTTALMSANKVVQGSAQLIQDNTPLGPAGSNLATNLTIDLALANVGKLKYGIQFAKNANNARRVLALRNIGTALSKPGGVKLLAGMGSFGSDITDLKTLRELLFDFSGVSPDKLAGEQLRSKKLWQLLEERNNPTSTITASTIDRQLAVLALTDMEGKFATRLAKHTGDSESLILSLKNHQANIFNQKRGFTNDALHHIDGLIITGKDVVTQTPGVRTGALKKIKDVQGKVFGDQPGAITSQPYSVHKRSHRNPESGKVDWQGEWIGEETGPALPAGSSLEEVYRKISKTSELTTEATKKAAVSNKMTKHRQAVQDTIPTNLRRELGINFDPYATDLTPEQAVIWRSHIQNLPSGVKSLFKNQ